jgi:hypothetical protein
MIVHNVSHVSYVSISIIIHRDDEGTSFITTRRLIFSDPYLGPTVGR